MFDLRKQKNQIMQVNTFKAAYIDKTVIKLTEEVILNMGITFEPMVDGTYFNNGIFNTRLHYKVLLTNPIYAPNLEKHDSCVGYGTEFSQMSFTLLLFQFLVLCNQFQQP